MKLATIRTTTTTETAGVRADETRDVMAGKG